MNSTYLIIAAVMSLDEDDYAREEYESEIARQALKEDGLRYALEEHPEEIRDEVEQWQAQEWLEQSQHWLRLVNIISQHDREQLRESVRNKAIRHGGPTDGEATRESRLFNLASEISAFLESLVDRRFHTNQTSPTASAEESATAGGYGRYGYCPGPPVQSLAHYSEHCNVCESLHWVSDLLKITKAFRDILFVIGDSRKRSLEWELADHVRAIDSALESGAGLRLVYRGPEGKWPKFGRVPNPTTTPISSLLAEWICEYLVCYVDRIDFGTCVECGKIFSRQRRDNSYCSKTCQNRIAYKRKKMFDAGLLQKIELTPTTKVESVKSGVWAYHPRLGLGLVEGAAEKYGSLASVRVRFPQSIRAFSVSGLAQAEHDGPKIEFYRATDAAALSEFL